MREKNEKNRYVHIIPRILLGILFFSAVVAFVLLPMLSKDLIAVDVVADASTALPAATVYNTATPFAPTPEITSTPVPSSTDTPTATPGAVLVMSAYTTLKLGDDNAAVVALQQRLMALGYLDHDEPSSLYNESIRDAVILFQRACDLEQTGIADSAMQESLFSDSVQTYCIKRTDSGKDVESMQQRLTDLGYYEDRSNGYFGPLTEEAVMHFQAINSLTVNGVLDYDDWNVLYSAEAKEAPVPATPTPTPKPTARRTSSSTGSKTTATPKPNSTSGATAQATSTSNSSSGSGSSSASYSYSASGLCSCAADQMGKTYVWGDEGPDSFDCSGLVYYCLKKCGVSVSRTNAKSYSQKSGWTLVSSIDELQKGDLVFFKSDSSDSVSHTGIYIGSGRFIHASSSKGEVVRSSISGDYWVRNFVCGRRVFG